MKKRPPELLNKIVDVVLAYSPQRKQKESNKRSKGMAGKKKKNGRS
jgi:hypothetical protein